MKKLCSTILILFLLLTNLSFAQPSSWAQSEINKSITSNIATQELLSNYQAQITREEFAALALKLYEALKGQKAIAPSTNPFNDTTNQDVLKANALGIVGGVGSGKFDPKNTVTREQVSAMFYRVLNAVDPSLLEGDYSANFTDKNTISSWGLNPIAFMASKEIVGGVGSGRFDPQGKVSREVALLMAVRMYTKFNSLPPQEALTIQFIDVGQGDSVLITDGLGNDLLIDGGDSKASGKILSELLKYNIDDFEYIIATHPHEDHIGSLDDVMAKYTCENIIMPPVTADTASYRSLETAIDAGNVNKVSVTAGQKIALGKAEITILSDGTKAYDDINNNSIVIRVDYGSKSIILTGDAENKVEQEIIASGYDINVDYLKLGHHGSGSSTTAQFLYKASPDTAVISVGTQNQYGHPDPLILNRLAIQKITSIYRTDLNGDITIKLFNEDSLIYASKSEKILAVVQPPTPTVPVTPQIQTTPPASTSNVGKIVFTNIDKNAEIVTIKNTSTVDIALTGWRIVSAKGNQQFTFQAFTLKAGASVKVGGYGSIVDLKWEDGRGVWNNSDDDDGYLYDASGNQVAYWND